MKISVIQSRQYVLYDVENPGSFTFEQCMVGKEKSVTEVLALLEEAGKQGTDFAVTTETFNASILPGDVRYDFSSTAEPLDGPIIISLKELAVRHQMYIVAGLFTKRNGNVYNSAVLLNPKGTIQGIYDKTHLIGAERNEVTPGDTYPVFDTSFGRVAMLICWDMQYPEAAREVSLAGADLIACPTWGWESIYGLARAYENSVTIAAANILPPHGEMWEWCSPSAVVDNMGRIQTEAPRNHSGIATATIDIRKEPALQYGGKGQDSMRCVRATLRRPDTYRQIVKEKPDVLKRYE